MNRPIIVASAGIVVLAAGFTALTLGFSGTTSTTALDSRSTVKAADGGLALQSNIVAGRIASKYHPLPWIGSAVGDVSCPSPLPAEVDSTITCTATSDGTTVRIDVKVLEATPSSITWNFAR